MSTNSNHAGTISRRTISPNCSEKTPVGSKPISRKRLMIALGPGLHHAGMTSLSGMTDLLRGFLAASERPVASHQRGETRWRNDGNAFVMRSIEVTIAGYKEIRCRT